MENYLFKKYKGNCSLFIETGSYIGDGITEALEANFDKIISIELAPAHYQFCKDKFKDEKNVEVIFGASEHKLQECLEANLQHKEVFFWLDAHGSGGQTVGGSVLDAITKELKVIIEFQNKHHKHMVLLLDDINDDAKAFLDKSNLKYIGKENCVNKYTSRIETDRSVYIYEIE